MHKFTFRDPYNHCCHEYLPLALSAYLFDWLPLHTTHWPCHTDYQSIQGRRNTETYCQSLRRYHHFCTQDLPGYTSPPECCSSARSNRERKGIDMSCPIPRMIRRLGKGWSHRLSSGVRSWSHRIPQDSDKSTRSPHPHKFLHSDINCQNICHKLRFEIIILDREQDYSEQQQKTLKH